MSPLKNSFKRSISLTLNAYFQHFKIENKQDTSPGPHEKITSTSSAHLDAPEPGISQKA